MRLCEKSAYLELNTETQGTEFLNAGLLYLSVSVFNLAYMLRKGFFDTFSPFIFAVSYYLRFVYSSLFLELPQTFSLFPDIEKPDSQSHLYLLSDYKVESPYYFLIPYL